MPFAASMVVFPGGRLDRKTPLAADPVRACALRETEEETGVRFDAADLQDWAHWITPELEPRRYDTQFFVAALPGRWRATCRARPTARLGAGRAPRRPGAERSA